MLYEVIIPLILALFVSAIVGYIWPNVFPSKVKYNMINIYQTCYSVLLGGLIGVFVSLIMIYIMRYDPNVELYGSKDY